MLSSTPPQPGTTPGPLPDTATLASLRFSNGQIVLCTLPAGTAIAAPAPSPAATRTVGKDGALHAVAAAPPPPPVVRELTPRCTHGVGGVCMYCCPPTEADYAQKKEELLNAAGRYAPRHTAKSSVTIHGEGADMEWLCRHRPDAMCTNCAPLRKGDTVPLPMLCQHGPDAKCTNW